MTKKIKFTLSLVISMLFCGVSIHASMFPDENGNIEINGSKKRMLGHIINLKFDQNDPFKNTHIITYEEDRFTIVGTVTDFPKQYIALIGENNYTYISFYTMKKVNEMYEKFGAILVGHKDKELVKKLDNVIFNNLAN